MSSWHGLPNWLLIIPSSYLIYRFTRTILALIRAIVLYLILPIVYPQNLEKYKNRWTVVSGATDGIGKGYTFELAKRGLRKFLLIGRNPQKLENVKSELENNFSGCEIGTLFFDFSYGDFNKLRDALANVNIGLAINSVGVGRDLVEKFGETPEADSQLLRVNGVGAAEFLSCVLQPMNKHGGGQIVVLSSSQGIRPIPLLAAYSATKALMSCLSEAIDREYSNINVQCLTPALVATKMTYYKERSLFIVSTDDFAKDAVNVLGRVHRTSGCFNHEIQLLPYQLIPWRILRNLIMPIYWNHQRRMMRIQNERKNKETDSEKEENEIESTSITPPLSPSRKISKIPVNGVVIRNRA